MTPQERVRLALSARVRDLLSLLPEDLDLTSPLLESAANVDGIEVVMSVRRAGRAAPDVFGPLCGLNAVEQAVVAVLLAGGNRRQTLTQLRGPVGGRHKVGDGPLRFYLSRLADPLVGVLTNSKTARPPGYALSEGFLAALGGIDGARNHFR